MTEARPLIGVIADFRIEDPHSYHCVGDKYIRAVVDGTRGIPFIIPALGADLNFEQVLAPLDGLLLTGGYSNIEPWRYGAENIETDPVRDAARDETACRLIDTALARKLPVLGICRGFQEINVALGGSLHQKVQEVPGLMDHREDKTQALEQQYGPAHDVTISPGGYLAQCSDDLSAAVNTVHQQGIDRLADGLEIEATAPDGLIEAYRLPVAEQFLLAVQWHPEWQVTRNPFYLKIFQVFGQACLNDK